MTPEEKERYDRTMAEFAIIENQRKLHFNNILPSWSQVEIACDSISSLAEAKTFLNKLARVVYWLARNSET